MEAYMIILNISFNVEREKDPLQNPAPLSPGKETPPTPNGEVPETIPPEY